ncbi:PAS domain S-box protein, partial [Paenibacillus dakarensis]|uniref:PAS domain S-box protein n=1 Tax=Paenibacillus dakarensis TaxID=1527293 RepID=UPI0006D5833B
MLEEKVNQETIFQHMYQYAPIGVAILSLDGKWLKVNPALSRMFGYTELEMQQILYENCVLPEDRSGMDIMSGLINKDTVHEDFKQHFLRKDHSILNAFCHVILQRNEFDEPLYFISYITDITEKISHKLPETEEIVRLIPDKVQEIIFCISTDGNWDYCSPSSQELLGYRPSELIGRSNEELCHPEDLDTLHTLVDQDSGTALYRFRHKNGSYLWLETTVQKIAVDGAVSFLCVGRDITERKRIKDTLNEAERIAAIGSWEWDIINKKVELSDQVYRVCKLDRKSLDLAAFNILDFVDDCDRVDLARALRRALRGDPFNYEYRLSHNDGTIQYFHLRGVVSYNDLGRPVKMIGTIQDITERVEMEMKLQETVERYTSLKKYNHDAVISLDLNGHVIHGNIMAERLTGYNIKEMTGKNLTQFIVVQNLKEILMDSLKDVSSDNRIEYFKHKDGHLIEVMTTIAPIIINGKNVGFYIIAKDITEQKKLLIAKEAAESTNLAKSAFLAMMSHEIRTPMNGVIGMTDLLIDSPGLNEEQKDYVRIIRKSGETLLNIINDILDFSKVESGKTTLVHEPFRLQNAIEETLDLLNPKAVQKKLEMKYSMSPGVPKVLIGDSERLKQILFNLIGNALKFTFTGGVYIEIREIDSTKELVQLEFTIRDTGIGIPEDKANDLFEPFYQLDHFMTRKHEGTGLGLAISRKLVELMHGSIWLERNDQPGATFKFNVYFNRCDEDIADEDNAALSSTDQHLNLHILVGEDNETNQLVILKMLEKMGYQVDVAANGKEVLERVRQHHYDLIFMDVHMPELNGLEAAKAIKGMLPPNEVPIIVAV